MEPTALALERFGNGYNCAQAVASVFWEKYGLSDELGMRITSGLGGGYRIGEVCGAATGAVTVIGLKPHNQKNLSADSLEFFRRFRAIRNAVTCKEILNATPEERALRTPDEKAMDKTTCNSLVEEAVRILVDLGY